MSLLADMTLTSETIMLISGGVSAAWLASIGAITYLFRLLMSAKDKAQDKMESMYETQLRDEKARNKVLKKMSDEAVDAVEAAAAEMVAREGHTPVRPVAPVVAPHDSPVTEEAQALADLQTNQARLVAAKLALGLEPVEAGVLETGEQREARVGAEVKTTPPPYVPDQILDSIADVKKDIAELPAKVAEKIQEQEESPGG